MKVRLLSSRERNTVYPVFRNTIPYNRVFIADFYPRRSMRISRCYSTSAI